MRKTNHDRKKAPIFSYDSSFQERFIKDYPTLKEFVEHCRGLGLRIVLTQGTYDMVHIGHARYLEKAKKFGDLLIVGLDSDEKVRRRKGPERPVVPQEERLEIVTHMRPVDIVTLKEIGHPKWHLIKTVRPDVLVATQQTYDEKEISELKKYCGQVIVLEPMATTSTSAKIRRMQLQTAKTLQQKLTPKLLDVIEEVLAQGNK
jgi:rfaE bifunctional protein nucleotidyltransferase chain/domain